MLLLPEKNTASPNERFPASRTRPGLRQVYARFGTERSLKTTVSAKGSRPRNATGNVAWITYTKGGRVSAIRIFHRNFTCRRSCSRDSIVTPRSNRLSSQPLRRATRFGSARESEFGLGIIPRKKAPGRAAEGDLGRAFLSPAGWNTTPGLFLFYELSCLSCPIRSRSGP